MPTLFAYLCHKLDDEASEDENHERSDADIFQDIITNHVSSEHSDKRKGPEASTDDEEGLGIFFVNRDITQ